MICSLAGNFLYAEGAKHICDMLKVNTVVTELKCACFTNKHFILMGA